jgi:hypothetical protein
MNPKIELDIVDEALNYFKANVFFRFYEIKVGFKSNTFKMFISNQIPLCANINLQKWILCHCDQSKKYYRQSNYTAGFAGATIINHVTVDNL